MITIHQDNNSRADGIIFTMPDTKDKEKAWTLRPRQKIKRDKPAALYRHLIVIGDLILIDLNKLKIPKKILQYYSFTMVINGFLWQKKQASFLHQKH